MAEKGSLIGAGVGSIFGPLGTVVGGGIGGAVSQLFGGSKSKPKPPPPPWYVTHKVPLMVGAAVVAVSIPTLAVILTRK